MVVHRRKKSKKKRWKKLGSERRGAGCRGGRGRAGFGKRAAHRKALAIKLGLLPGYDNRGFTSITKVRRRIKEITLDQINELLWNLKQEGKPLELNLIELGYDKVIGRGKLMFPAKIIAKYFTEGAKKKIQEAGGTFVEVH